MKSRLKVILAKIEATYGADPAPTGAANAILVSNPTLSPMESDKVDRNLDRAYLGGDIQFVVGEHVMMEFNVELAGAGAAGTVPAYGPLLRACGLAETQNVGTSVEYDPVSAGEESATLYWNQDGHNHAMNGARGSVSLQLDPKGLPYLNFKLTGLYVDPAAVELPTADYTAFQAPKPVSNANTPTFSLHGYAAVVSAFSFNQGNSVNHHDLINEAQVDITDRKANGSITIDSPALGTKDYFAIAKASTTGALQWVHGTAAGHIAQFDAPAVQVLDPSYGDRDGTVTLEMGLNFTPSSGDDEFKLTVK